MKQFHGLILSGAGRLPDMDKIVIGTPFTSESARSSALLGWQRRRQRKIDELNHTETLRNTNPQAQLLAQELNRLLELIMKSKDSLDLQRLTAAHERLFKTWQVLTGTPSPPRGRVKSGHSVPASGANPVEPLPNACQNGSGSAEHQQNLPDA